MTIKTDLHELVSTLQTAIADWEASDSACHDETVAALAMRDAADDLIDGLNCVGVLDA